MALDNAFFDHLHLTLRKKKYYDAAEVEDLLDRIRWEAEELNKENASLRKKLETQAEKNADVADAVLSAQEVCRQIIDQANHQAAQILADAETKGWDIRQERIKRNEYAVGLVEDCMRSVLLQQEAAVNTVKDAWQRYLCGLYQEAEIGAHEAAPQEAPEPPELAVPSDLSERIGAIARELDALQD